MLVTQFIAKILPQFIKWQVVSGRKKTCEPTLPQLTTRGELWQKLDNKL